MPQLSAIVITRNEAANIGECLDSLAFCDERIVVDCGSTDSTVDIAREKGARVEFHEWRGFGPQKSHALALATGTWVLSIDADERVTPELAAASGGDRRGRRRRLSFRGSPASAAARCAIPAGIPITCCGCFAAARPVSMTSSTSG
jgi:glycosyltransferase involved in cell wall biosynthesis